MSVRVRFAPSPTGKLHIGNIRTALMNVLFAKANQGTFVMRMEDTDMEREVDGAEEKMFADMAWLGMVPDEGPHVGGAYAPYRTSERATRGDYQKALEKLFADGRAYECFVSKDELDLMRKIQRSQNKAPHYDNRHRNLSEEQKAKYRAEGREPVIRFKLNEGKIVFDDIVRGRVEFDAAHLGGDPVIVRTNGVPIFAFGGAVDDINQEITHVLRGEDHVTNTAIQVQMFEALGAKVPVFAHMPMLADSDGGKLSKRLDGLSVGQLRERGFHPYALVTYVASLGFSEMPEIGSVETIAKTFDLSKMGRSSVRFDMHQLERMNATVLRELSLEEAQPYLALQAAWQAVPEEQREAFWLAVRGNIEVLSDIAEHAAICFKDVTQPSLPGDDKDYLKSAAAVLPKEPYTKETWQAWVSEIKTRTDRKGKALFMPLRLALTGREHGPELADLMPIIGEDTLRRRLEQAIR